MHVSSIYQVILEAVDKPRSSVQSKGAAADLVTETGGCEERQHRGRLACKHA